MKYIKFLMEEENFILPETERAINSIIAECSRFFGAARIAAAVLCLAYMVSRAFLFPSRIWLDVLLCALCLSQCVFLALEAKGRIAPGRSALVLRVAKRLASFAMLLVVLHDLFAFPERVGFWQVALCILMGAGWIVLLLGDIFELTVPRYSRMILLSFKKDIEPRALISRGMNEAKSAAKDALGGNRAAKIAGAVFSAGILGVVARKFFRHKGSHSFV